ncbi:hypothetical protein [Leisingera sp. JC1]|uniref:hypothetical protein n=1 Tax=Leisingera sp. JC1 TaxID=1855282 RepID=UPI0008036F42|nr:hypothetical protein [Leisingera sp. JC1]OBY24195.1 hypothetical protein A9D60_24630 [Leisingera sp. JC1]
MTASNKISILKKTLAKQGLSTNDSTAQRDTVHGLKCIDDRGQCPLGHQRINMGRKADEPFAGIAFGLQHFLQCNLMCGVVETLALKTLEIQHRPQFGTVINPTVPEQERRYVLALVALVLRRAFPDPVKVAHRFMGFVRNPDRRQLPSAK